MDAMIKFMFFMSSCSAMPSLKVMYALMNKDMRSMWPVRRSRFSSQTDKHPRMHLPSPNVLLKLGQTSAACTLPNCVHWVQTISSSFKKDHTGVFEAFSTWILYTNVPYFELQILCLTLRLSFFWSMQVIYLNGEGGHWFHWFDLLMYKYHQVLSWVIHVKWALVIWWSQVHEQTIWWKLFFIEFILLGICSPPTSDRPKVDFLSNGHYNKNCWIPYRFYCSYRCFSNFDCLSFLFVVYLWQFCFYCR